MQLRACIVGAALLACAVAAGRVAIVPADVLSDEPSIAVAGDAARATPLRVAANQDTANADENGGRDIPVPPRAAPATGSLADLITSLRARGPIPPSENDALLREEIIRGMLALPARPPFPAAAKARFDRALRAASRKPPAAPEQTLRELAFVLGEAPWWPEPYLEIAKVEERLGHLENAVVDLELYLVAKPDAKDWKRVRGKIRDLRMELLGPQ